MATKAKPYTCIHCGEPCGVQGHLIRTKRDLFGVRGTFCPVVGLVRLTEGGEIYAGFGCQPGHACLTTSALQQDFGRSVMTEAIEKKKHDRWGMPATAKQLEYLDVLGYKGPRPVTKGQARTLLDRILKGGEAEETEETALLPGRSIIVRNED